MGAKFKAVIPKKFNTSALTGAIGSEISAFSQESKTDLLRPTSTWSTTPKFEIQTRTTRTKIRVFIFTTDNRYRYLDRGTRVRYATMTPNFSPKTKPNTLSASTGSGGVAYVDIGLPRRGIDARNFVEQVKRIQEPKLAKRFSNAFRKGAIKSGHAI